MKQKMSYIKNSYKARYILVNNLVLVIRLIIGSLNIDFHFHEYYIQDYI